MNKYKYSELHGKIIATYGTLASFAEAIFTNATAVTGAFVLALYYVSATQIDNAFFQFNFLDSFIDNLSNHVEKMERR